MGYSGRRSDVGGFKPNDLRPAHHRHRQQSHRGAGNRRAHQSDQGLQFHDRRRPRRVCRHHQHLAVFVRRSRRRRRLPQSGGDRGGGYRGHLAAWRFRHCGPRLDWRALGLHAQQWPGDDRRPGHGVRYLPGRRDSRSHDRERPGRPTPYTEAQMNPQDIAPLGPDAPVILEMRHISKSFGAVTALVDASIRLHHGEVLALVGDNGAGKSTLIKILSGFHQPDGGAIILNGEEVHFASPRDARAAGIETVYQDLALIGDLSIFHNMFLGREYHKRILGLNLLDNTKMRDLAVKYLKTMEISIHSVNSTVDLLSGGQRQCVAVARSIYLSPTILVLVEPLAALGGR